MATTFSNSKTYAGELARPYIAAAIKSAPTIGEGRVTVKENVKYREVLRKLDTAGIVQAAACDFTPAGVVDLSEIVLEPTELMSNLQLCKKDFRADWEALNTGRGFINDQLPPEFQQYLLLHVASKIGESMEDNVWKGGTWDSAGASSNDLSSAAADGADSGATAGDSLTDTFDNNHFTGLLQRISDGGSNTQSEGSGAAFSTSNILTNLDTCIDALPSALQGDQEVKIYMSPKSYYIYYRKLVSAGTHPGFNYATDINNNYLGYQLHVCPGMSNDAVVAARPDNLFFGTDLKSDHNSAVFIDMTGQDGSDNVRIAYRFTGGTQVGVAGDCSLVSRYATT
ncbi:MAG: hypothetical protein Unbinned1529contig1001_15 [Prokaryotic dsDNA virus sp.]|nr:MAG: hypothetical protein Unbinned1529contig1001_15 [Prokaryotic dsDNA virus sp.]